MGRLDAIRPYGDDNVKLRCSAPAKINLGLEILSKRQDGFHEIRTILHMVQLFDEVSVEFSDSMQFVCDDASLGGADNLAVRAAEYWRDTIDPQRRNARIELRKTIPAAAGLGGASADAAAVLILLEEIARAESAGSFRQMPVDERMARLHNVASMLGSDVPFFLGGGCAFAHGRGELLDPVAPLERCTFVIATPPIDIPRKTATMYGGLEAARDFSDGSGVDANRTRLNAGSLTGALDLSNAFERPLRTLYPEVEQIAEVMGFYADGQSGVAGAGPSWFALFQHDERALELVDALAKEVPSARIVITKPFAGPIDVTPVSGA